MGHKNLKLLLILLLVGIFLSRLVAILFLEIEPESDYAAYLKMAETIIETGIMDDGQGNVAFFSAGYPLFLSVFIALFGNDPLVFQFINVVLSTISGFLLYKCSKEIFGHSVWMLLPVFFFAAYPPLTLYAEYAAKENLLIPLMLTQTLILLRFLKGKKGILNIILLGLCFSAQLMVGAAMLFTIIPCLFILLEIDKNTSSFSHLQWKNVAIFSIFIFIGLVPWLNYTNTILNKPILTTNGGFNLYLGNNENSSVEFMSIQDTPIGPNWHQTRERLGEVESMAFLKTEAYDYILNNPLETLGRSVKKVLYFWTPPIHDAKGGNASTIETLIRLIWMITYCILFILFLFAFLRIKNFSRAEYTVLSTILLYCLIHGATYVIFRYRLPIMPMVMIISTIGVQWLFEYFTVKKIIKK